ncbi:MAG: SDR family oxidoreductase [Chloroflexi bacterium]|nr:SDR family oxidoreductase [Chloroflexota bacterium]
MTEQHLKEKVVLVTGGARRVGRAFALTFAAAGARVVIHHSRSDADAEATTREVAAAGGIAPVIVKADLRDHGSTQAMFREIEARCGRLDVLVNSASVFLGGDLLDLPAEDWDEALAVNLRAPFWCTQMAGRMMRDRQIAGCIINIADNSGLQPWSERPQHSVSKAGLIMLTQVTAKALARHQIRANCLVLGPVLPENDRNAASIRATAERLPLGRWGAPEDAARAALFLAANDFITGAVFAVDGGEHLV